MAAGRLAEKNGYFYIVLGYNGPDGKRVQKWQGTGLPVKGPTDPLVLLPLQCKEPPRALLRAHRLKEHGLREIRFYEQRHSCASLLLKQGVPMKQIQEWLLECLTSKGYNSITRKSKAIMR